MDDGKDRLTAMKQAVKDIDSVKNGAVIKQTIKIKLEGMDAVIFRSFLSMCDGGKEAEMVKAIFMAGMREFSKVMTKFTQGGTNG